MSSRKDAQHDFNREQLPAERSRIEPDEESGSVAFGSDSNDESDRAGDEWDNEDPFERDLYGRGRFDR